MIASVRENFSGSITYDAGGLLYHGDETTYTTESFDANWEPPSIGGFAANLDYIGVDWYPQMTTQADASADEMATNAQRMANQFLVPLWQTYQKPILFAEIDYSSMDRTAINPLKYRHGGSVDQDEQAVVLHGKRFFKHLLMNRGLLACSQPVSI